MKTEVNYVKPLDTAVFRIGVGEEDMPFLLRVAADYMDCTDSDLAGFKARVLGLCGLRSGQVMQGRVGIDVVMLFTPTLSKIICLDVRDADAGRLAIYLCECGEESPYRRAITPNVLRTFELFEALVLAGDAALDAVPVVRGALVQSAGAYYADLDPDLATGPAYPGPAGAILALREVPRDTACSNCFLSASHERHGLRKYTDGQYTSVALCPPCHATLGAVPAAIRWKHVWAAQQSNYLHLPRGVTPEEHHLSYENQNIRCSGCLEKGIPSRLYKCQSRQCRWTFFCPECATHAKQRHTFGHRLEPYVSDREIQNSRIIH